MLNEVVDQVFCSGQMTNEISFGGGVPGTVYRWTNDNTSIGLPASGSGNIVSFRATNVGIATITVTPEVIQGGTVCAGTPRTFTISVESGVQIVRQPVGVSICAGDTFELSVEAIGENLTYQWFWDNQVILGATSPTFAPAAGEGQAGMYFVEITASCGTITSSSVEVQISDLQILQKWDDVLFVSNLGDMFVAYQWYRNSRPIGRNGQFQYYSEQGGLMPGTYQVRVTYIDGTYAMSCPFIVEERVSSGGSSTIRIYPNPVQIGREIVIDLSQLSVEESLNARVIIYDMSGRTMAHSMITSPVENITVNVPVAGNYIVRVITGSGRVQTEKIVVIE